MFVICAIDNLISINETFPNDANIQLLFSFPFFNLYCKYGQDY